MKWKAFFIILKGFSSKQIKQFFFKVESPTLILKWFLLLHGHCSFLGLGCRRVIFPIFSRVSFLDLI